MKLLYKDGTDSTTEENYQQLIVRHGLQSSLYQEDEHSQKGGVGIVFRAPINGDPAQAVAIKVFPLSTPRSLGNLISLENNLNPVLLELGRESDLLLTANSWGSTERGDPYIVMDYADGLLLTKCKSHENVSTTLDLADKLLQSAVLLHSRSLIHGDINPGNVLLAKSFKSDSPRLHLFDFDTIQQSDTTDYNRVHRALGTHGFSPYEWYDQDSSPTPHYDVFALSATIYFMLTGEYAFDHVMAEAMFGASIEELRPQLKVLPLKPSIKNPALPSTIDRVIMRGLSPNPKYRYRDAISLQRAFRKALQK